MTFNQRETLSINIGQAGVQIGNTTWQLYCLEHGISPDGTRENQNDCLNAGFNSFFEETHQGKFIPRSIFIDTEPTVVDEVRIGANKNLYHPDHLISGKEDAANNFVRGYHSIGCEMIDLVAERIRRMVERTNNLQGFFLCHSYGGGTGSGFSAKLLDQLMEDYPRRAKFQKVVYPAPFISSTVVEPYNSVLTTHSTLDQVDCAFMFDNQALYDITHHKLGIERPTYTHLNRLMSQVISSVTTSLRFNGSLNVDLDDFRTNLVPFPRIHFPIAAYAPITPLTPNTYDSATTNDLTVQVFQSDNLMMKCDLTNGKYIACCMLYRGDVVPKDINGAIATIKQNRNIQFVDWCPTGFKIGINSKSPTFVPCGDLLATVRGVSMLASNTAIKGAFSALNRKFDLMFAKRAFVHWYLGEGMEFDEFNDARCNLAVLEKDYEEVESDTNCCTQNESNEFIDSLLENIV